MADRKISLNELSERVGVSAVRFSTLNAICKALNSQPGDILEFIDDDEDKNGVE